MAATAGHISLVEPPVRAPAEPERRGERSGSRAVWLIALCCLAAALRLGREALIPLGLAVLVACVLSGAVEGLRRWRVPRALSAMLLLVLLSLGLAATIDLIASPAQAWLQKSPQVLRTIEQKARPAQSIVRRLDYIARRATALASAVGGGTSAPASPAPAAPAASLTAIDIFAATGSAAVALVTVLAFAFLLLAGGPSALARLTCALGARVHSTHALEIIDTIRREVSRYYGTLLLINLAFAAVTAGVLWLLGLPNPALWGVLAGLLNFIPYLGPAVCVTVLTLVGLVTFAGVAHVLLVAAAYLVLATVEGHLIEPLFLGRRLHLNPVVVLLGVWSGGWLWGVAGVVLALPVLLALKIATRMTAGTARQP